MEYSSRFTIGLLILVSSFSLVDAYRLQSVGVRGRLTCGSRPLANTQVRLWNKNTFDIQGSYEISGSMSSFFDLNVHFIIYHDCDDAIVPCQRTVDLKIPSQYVTRTDKVQQWFDAGVLNMAFKYPDEERTCFGG